MDEFITGYYDFAEINKAFEALHSGDRFAFLIVFFFLTENNEKVMKSLAFLSSLSTLLVPKNYEFFSFKIYVLNLAYAQS